MRWTGLGIVVLGVAAMAWADAPALDLKACYERALAHSERVEITVAEWRAAEARYRQARDTLWPALSLTAGQEFQNESPTSGNGSRSSREAEQFEARLRAEQTLYSGFRLTRQAEARAAEGRALELTSARVRELLYLDVADTFYEVLRQQEDLVVLARLEASLQETVSAVAQRVDLGRSRRADLLNAQTDLAEVQVELETARGGLEAGRELLSFLIDLPSSQIVVEDRSPLPQNPDLAEKLARVTQRADVLAGEARVEAAGKEEQAARAERQPQVGVAGDLFLLQDPDQDDEWNILFTLELPLFDEGVIRSRVAERAALSRISELNLAAVRRSAASEVRAAYIVFMTAAAQRGRLSAAVRSAREHYEVQKKDYELGRASQLDELSALAQWQRLRRREVATDMLARASLVRLHVAAGGAAP